jgi:hypothetical protein
MDGPVLVAFAGADRELHPRQVHAFDAQVTPERAWQARESSGHGQAVLG